MPETFSPPMAPSVGQTAKQTQTRSLLAQFGDGYSQRAGDGINAAKVVLPLEWKMLSDSQGDAIEAFLAARRGYEAFFYTLPTTGAELKFVAQSWERVPLGAGLCSISTTFEQVFDL